MTADPTVNLRRSAILAAGLGLVCVAVSSLMGHPFFGIFFCIGTALGAWNNKMLQKSVIAYGSSATPSKGAFTRGVFVRLTGITILAFALALFVRPDGFGVFGGMAVFQILMLVGASIPVFRSLKAGV